MPCGLGGCNQNAWSGIVQAGLGLANTIISSGRFSRGHCGSGHCHPARSGGFFQAPFVGGFPNPVKSFASRDLARHASHEQSALRHGDIGRAMHERAHINQDLAILSGSRGQRFGCHSCG